ncbi:hypothetical protein [Rosenbergiella nectarea]
MNGVGCITRIMSVGPLTILRYLKTQSTFSNE